MALLSRVRRMFSTLAYHLALSRCPFDDYGSKGIVITTSRMLSRMLACRIGPGKLNLLVQIQEQEERILINALNRGR